MLKRTTISFNQDYLDFLKLLSLKRKKTLSNLVNEAVRIYLSKVETKSDNRLFFNNLAKLKKELKLTRKDLLGDIRKGRL